MIRKMRLRIIIISMTALIILLVSIFLATNIYMNKTAINDTDRFLSHIIDNSVASGLHDLRPSEKRVRDELNGPPHEASPIRGVALKVNDEGLIKKIYFNDEDITEKEIVECVKVIIKKNTQNGSIDNYRYKVKSLDDGYIIVFANTQMQNDLLNKLLAFSIRSGLISLVLLFLFIVILSYYITKPVEETFLKQKRFIADSSHELKTPLSIMSANLEMLEMEVGSSRRISSISDNIKRMNKLIHELLILARTEQKIHSYKPFDLSSVIESSILSLEVLAFEQGNTIETNIEEKLVFNGDEDSIIRLINELMENAIKYSNKNTIIRVGLRKKGDSKIIEIYNEGIGVTKEQKERLFDKFYRVDDSRQRETGGYGIGLSIVKNIVDMHRGKIQVDSVPNEYIIFKIILH